MGSYRVNGKIYDIPAEKEQEFKSQFPNAEQVQTFINETDTFDIPLNKVEEFQKSFPKAQAYDPLKDQQISEPTDQLASNDQDYGFPIPETLQEKPLDQQLVSEMKSSSPMPDVDSDVNNELKKGMGRIKEYDSFKFPLPGAPEKQELIAQNMMRAQAEDLQIQKDIASTTGAKIQAFEDNPEEYEEINKRWEQVKDMELDKAKSATRAGVAPGFSDEFKNLEKKKQELEDLNVAANAMYHYQQVRDENPNMSSLEAYNSYLKKHAPDAYEAYITRNRDSDEGKFWKLLDEKSDQGHHYRAIKWAADAVKNSYDKKRAEVGPKLMTQYETVKMGLNQIGRDLQELEQKIQSEKDPKKQQQLAQEYMTKVQDPKVQGLKAKYDELSQLPEFQQLDQIASQMDDVNKEAEEMWKKYPHASAFDAVIKANQVMFDEKYRNSWWGTRLAYDFKTASQRVVSKAINDVLTLPRTLSQDDAYGWSDAMAEASESLVEFYDGMAATQPTKDQRGLMEDVIQFKDGYELVLDNNGSPTVVRDRDGYQVGDNLARQYVDLYTQNKDKYDAEKTVNYSTILPKFLKVTGDMGVMFLGANKVGGLAKTLKAGDKASDVIGLTTSVVAQTHNDAYKTAIENNMSPSEASRYALSVAGSVALIAQVNPQYYLWGRGSTAMLERKAANMLFQQGAKNATARKEVAKFILKEGMKEGIEESLEIPAEKYIGVAARELTEGRANIDAKDSFNEYAESFLLGFAGGAFFAGGNVAHSGGAEPYYNQLQRDALATAVLSPDKFDASIDKFIGKQMMINGKPAEFTAEMAANFKGDLNRLRARVGSVITNKKLSQEQKSQVVNLEATRRAVEQQMAQEELSPNVQKRMKEQIKMIEEQMDMIMGSQPNDPYYEIDGRTVERKDLDELMANPEFMFALSQGEQGFIVQNDPETVENMMKIMEGELTPEQQTLAEEGRLMKSELKDKDKQIEWLKSDPLAYWEAQVKETSNEAQKTPLAQVKHYKDQQAKKKADEVSKNKPTEEPLSEAEYVEMLNELESEEEQNRILAIKDDNESQAELKKSIEKQRKSKKDKKSEFKEVPEMEQALDPFREIARESETVEDFIKNVRQVKGVKPEVAEYYKNKYGADKNVEGAAKKFIDEVKAEEDQQYIKEDEVKMEESVSAQLQAEEALSKENTPENQKKVWNARLKVAYPMLRINSRTGVTEDSKVKLEGMLEVIKQQRSDIEKVQKYKDDPVLRDIHNRTVVAQQRIEEQLNPKQDTNKEEDKTSQKNDKKESKPESEKKTEKKKKPKAKKPAKDESLSKKDVIDNLQGAIDVILPENTQKDINKMVVKPVDKHHYMGQEIEYALENNESIVDDLKEAGYEVRGEGANIMVKIPFNVNAEGWISAKTLPMMKDRFDKEYDRNPKMFPTITSPRHRNTNEAQYAKRWDNGTRRPKETVIEELEAHIEDMQSNIDQAKALKAGKALVDGFEKEMAVLKSALLQEQRSKPEIEQKIYDRNKKIRDLVNKKFKFGDGPTENSPYLEDVMVDEVKNQAIKDGLTDKDVNKLEAIIDKIASKWDIKPKRDVKKNDKKSKTPRESSTIASEARSKRNEVESATKAEDLHQIIKDSEALEAEIDHKMALLDEVDDADYSEGEITGHATVIGSGPQTHVKIPVRPIYDGPQDLNLDTIIKEFSESIGKMPFYTKRMHRKNVAGYYAPWDTGVRMKTRNLDVLAHEMGHMLDDRHQVFNPEHLVTDEETGEIVMTTVLKKSDPYYKEAAQLWNGGSQPPAHLSKEGKQKYRLGEALAEYVRARVVNPEATAEKFPLLTKRFERQVPEETIKALDDYGYKVRVYAGYPASQKVQAARSKEIDESTGLIKKIFNPKLWGKGQIFTWKDMVAYRLLNSLRPANRIYTEALKRKGGEPMPEDHFITLSRLFLGSDNKINDFLVNGFQHAYWDKKDTRHIIDKATGEKMNLNWLVGAFDNTSEETISKEMEESINLMTAQRTLELPKKLARWQALKDLEVMHETGVAPNMEVLKLWPDLLNKTNRFGETWLEAFERLEKKGLLTGQYKEARYDFTRENFTGASAGLGQTDYQLAEEQMREFDDLKDRNPEKASRLSESARRYRKWADATIQYLRDKGRISTEQLEEIRLTNQHYMSMKRVMELQPGNEIKVTTLSKTGRIGVTQQPLFQAKGSDRAVINPYTSLIENTYRMLKEADRNEVMQSFIAPMTEARGMHKGTPTEFDDLAVQSDAQTNQTVTVYVDGKAQHWLFVDDVVREQLTGLAQGEQDWIFDFIAIAPKIMRWSVTHSPIFAARNFTRDTFHRMMVSHTNELTVKGQAKGFANMFGKRDDWDLWQGTGGSQSGYYIKDRESYNKKLDQAIRDVAENKKNVLSSWDTIKDKLWDKGYNQFIQGSESANRVAEFRSAFEKAKKDGMDDYNASLYASFESRDLLDFGVMGQSIKWINKLMPFTNAHIQGLHRTYRAFTDGHWKRGMTLFSMYALIPSAAIRYMIHLLDEDDDYNQKPDYEKDLFYNIPLGDGHWLMIPRPFELGVMAASADRIISQAYGDPYGNNGYWRSALHTFMPFDEAIMAGPYKSILESWMNYDMFRDKQIIPFQENNLRVEKRKYKANGSRLGQVVGDALNWDPRKVDHFIKGQFTYAGKFALRLSDIGREDSRNKFDWTMSGFYKTDPAYSSREVQWVLNAAKEEGMTASNDYKVFSQTLGDYFIEPNESAKEVVRKRLVGIARGIREKWEFETYDHPTEKMKTAFSEASDKDRDKMMSNPEVKKFMDMYIDGENNFMETFSNAYSEFIDVNLQITDEVAKSGVLTKAQKSKLKGSENKFFNTVHSAAQPVHKQAEKAYEALDL